PLWRHAERGSSDDLTVIGDSIRNTRAGDRVRRSAWVDDWADAPDQLPTAGSGANSRTSCAQRQAAAILAAHCSASSREGTSMIVTPAMYALLSVPSVTVPSGATTLTLTSSWGYTPPANTHTPASM